MAPGNPCSHLPRRLQIVLSLTGGLLLCIIVVASSSSDGQIGYLRKVPYGPKIEHGVHHVVEGAQHVVTEHVPLFRAPAHTPPPEQANSSSGQAKWFSDWTWRNPFSSSVTFDEERAVLPPLRDRPPVYTYYDRAARRKDEKSRKAEQQLLQIWRRAWWAQGFKPIVLSKSEAMHNPLYRPVQGLQLEPEFEHELLRWLAWGNMGTGILSSFLLVPMAPYDDPLLSFLRRGEYPELTRYAGLGNGLFVGSKHDIKRALREAMASPAIKRVKYVDEALSNDTFKVDSKHDGLAFYSDATIKEKYSQVAQKLADLKTVPDGLAMLPSLINSHLHLTWQNTFSKGVAVLKPLPEHTTAVVEPAIEIARLLTQCPTSPIPSSCPPNRSKCKTCVSNVVPISISKVFKNDSSLFVLGTVPHPFTTQTLLKQTDAMDLAFIRRQTDRDVWIHAITNDLLGNGISSFDRLPSIKEAVASEFGCTRSMWLTAERPSRKESEFDQEQLNWIFGFEMPLNPVPNGMSETPVPGPERKPPVPRPEYGAGPVPSEADSGQDTALFEKAKLALQNSEEGGTNAAMRTKEAIEAWNLADTEAWKFTRAFNARRRLERQKWDDAERSFQGKGMFDRWIDKIA